MLIGGKGGVSEFDFESKRCKKNVRFFDGMLTESEGLSEVIKK